MDKIIVIEYLLTEAKERVQKIEKFNKKYGEEAKCGRDNRGFMTETRPAKALVIQNMKKIRQLASEISKGV